VPQRHQYATDVEGGAPVRIRLAISGRLDPAAYLGFVAERARWLDISGWGAATGPHSVIVVAAGPAAMVGALEMACLLGPLDALVAELAAQPEDGPVGAGFAIRRRPAGQK
jgi:acylphosphatase